MDASGCVVCKLTTEQRSEPDNKEPASQPQQAATDGQSAGDDGNSNNDDDNNDKNNDNNHEDDEQRGSAGPKGDNQGNINGCPTFAASCPMSCLSIDGFGCVICTCPAPSVPDSSSALTFNNNGCPPFPVTCLPACIDTDSMGCPVCLTDGTCKVTAYSRSLPSMNELNMGGCLPFPLDCPPECSAMSSMGCPVCLPTCTSEINSNPLLNPSGDGNSPVSTTFVSNDNTDNDGASGSGGGGSGNSDNNISSNNNGCARVDSDCPAPCTTIDRRGCPVCTCKATATARTTTTTTTDAITTATTAPTFCPPLHLPCQPECVIQNTAGCVVCSCPSTAVTPAPVTISHTFAISTHDTKLSTGVTETATVPDVASDVTQVGDVRLTCPPFDPHCDLTCMVLDAHNCLVCRCPGNYENKETPTQSKVSQTTPTASVIDTSDITSPMTDRLTPPTATKAPPPTPEPANPYKPFNSGILPSLSAANPFPAIDWNMFNPFKTTPQRPLVVDLNAVYTGTMDIDEQYLGITLLNPSSFPTDVPSTPETTESLFKTQKEDSLATPKPTHQHTFPSQQPITTQGTGVNSIARLHPGQSTPLGDASLVSSNPTNIKEALPATDQSDSKSELLMTSLSDDATTVGIDQVTGSKGRPTVSMATVGDAAGTSEEVATLTKCPMFDLGCPMQCASFDARGCLVCTCAGRPSVSPTTAPPLPTSSSPAVPASTSTSSTAASSPSSDPTTLSTVASTTTTNLPSPAAIRMTTSTMSATSTKIPTTTTTTTTTSPTATATTTTTTKSLPSSAAMKVSKMGGTPTKTPPTTSTTTTISPTTTTTTRATSSTSAATTPTASLASATSSSGQALQLQLQLQQAETKLATCAPTRCLYPCNAGLALGKDNCPVCLCRNVTASFPSLVITDD